MADNKLAPSNRNALFGIPVTGQEDLRQRLLNEAIMENSVGTNLTRPEYLQGVENITAYNPFDTKVWSAGYVSPRNPETVNINPLRYGGDMANVLAHEAAHTANILADRRVWDDKKKDTLYESLARSAALDRSLGYSSQIEENFQNYAANSKGEFLGGYGKSTRVPWDERIADLQSLEAQLPKGKTLLDTPLGKSIFNTPELKQYWLETSIPLAIKAIPQSPQYRNIAIDKIKQFNEIFQDEAKTTGYAQALIKALKKTATTEVTEPKYR